MTVGELMSLLDEYGAHVQVVVENDETGFLYTPDVDYHVRSGEGFVIIALDEKIEDQSDD